MKNTWTHKELNTLQQNYPFCTVAELCHLIPDKTYAALRSKIRVLKLNKETRHKITPEELRYIKEKYAIVQTKVLAEEMGISIYTINNIAFKNKLKKSPELIKQIFREKMQDPNHPGRKYLIKKGNTPPNKGKKQTEYMTQDAIDRTKATRFQKGQKVWNHKPIGYERITKDGYIEIKTAEPNVFELKHRLIWENKFGPIPVGHNVQFKDGIKTNVDPENLYLISRSDQMKFENSMYVRYPEEIQTAIKTIGALNRQINKQLKSE